MFLAMMPGIEMLSKRNPSNCSERLCNPSLVLNVLKAMSTRSGTNPYITYYHQVVACSKMNRRLPKKKQIPETATGLISKRSFLFLIRVKRYTP